MLTYNPGQKSWDIFAFVALFTTTHAPTPLTPACNVDPMYPHFFLKGGGGGEGRGTCQAVLKKIALFYVVYEGIITLTSQGL